MHEDKQQILVWFQVFETLWKFKLILSHCLGDNTNILLWYFSGMTVFV